LVRTSIPCYRDFILVKCRSLGFASASADLRPIQARFHYGYVSHDTQPAGDGNS
jgi:hypothetical protein